MKTRTPDKQALKYERLQKRTHQNLLQFIDAELKLAVTMSRLAQTEAERGNRRHAKMLLEKVQEAVDAVRKRMTDQILSDDERRKINHRVQDVSGYQRSANQTVLGTSSRAPRESA